MKMQKKIKGYIKIPIQKINIKHYISNEYKNFIDSKRKMSTYKIKFLFQDKRNVLRFLFKHG